MAITSTFYTEKTAGAKNNPWFVIDTGINQPISVSTRRLATGSNKIIRTVENQTSLYGDSDAATEPVTDDLLTTTAFGGPEATYTGSGNDYVISFTTDTGFFTSDQNLGACPCDWVIYWNGKITGVDSGYSGKIKFEFYKRDGSNNDTFLFSTETLCGGFKTVSGNTLSVTPIGNVTTSDRLRVRVYMFQTLPS